jgi:hypothetical protein
MFPRLREQIGTALDLIVEFSTLGEYRLAVDAAGAASAPVDAPSQAPQMGGAGHSALRAAVRRTVAGGAAGSTPVATPAARRLRANRAPSHVSGARPRPPRAIQSPRATMTRGRGRSRTPVAPEQLCLAV